MMGAMEKGGKEGRKKEASLHHMEASFLSMVK
jgi:hypothetical protein